jgi:hypothetical protein
MHLLTYTLLSGFSHLIQNTLQELSNQTLLWTRASQANRLFDIYEPTYSQQSLEQDGNLAHLIFDDTWTTSRANDALTKYFQGLRMKNQGHIGMLLLLCCTI